MLQVVRVWSARLRLDYWLWIAHYHRLVSGIHFYKALIAEAKASGAHADLAVLEVSGPND